MMAVAAKRGSDEWRQTFDLSEGNREVSIKKRTRDYVFNHPRVTKFKFVLSIPAAILSTRVEAQSMCSFI